MAQKIVARHTNADPTAIAVVLFGLDGNGKPKAARFPEKQANLAAKAAGQLKLQLLQIVGPEISDLAARIPAGRIHANGRGFVPYIRKDLYAKLVAAAGGSVNGAHASIHANSPSSTGPQPPKPSEGNPGFPQDWDSIAVGHVVIALEEPGEGWYEAIVADMNGDMLTMRWRDYPRERRITRHRLSVGLMYSPQQQPPTETVAKPAANSTVKSKSPASSETETSKPAYPKSWDDIDVDCLVLAKEDGPWRSWWEAVPTEKRGDQLLLRWRDFPKLPNITRPRLSLALLYPNGH